MDRKEKIGLASLAVGVIGQMINIFVNREKLTSLNSFWDFFTVQISIPVWILILFVFGSAILIWSNIPKKKKLKIADNHVSIMKVIANSDSPERDQILEVLLKNKIEITKTKLELHLSELKSNDYIDSYMGGYWLKDKARSYLVKKGYE